MNAAWPCVDAPGMERLASVIGALPPEQRTIVDALGVRDCAARAAWAAQHFPTETDDAAVATAWRAWFSGDPWRARVGWEARFLPVATRVFKALIAARSLPLHVRDRALRDLREAFFFVWLSGDPPVFAEVAARVVETRAEGPIAAIEAVLGPAGRSRALVCALGRTSMVETARTLVGGPPSPTSLGRLGALSTLVDAHVLCRVVGAVLGGHSEPAAVVTQNRARARARLRVIAAREHRGALANAVHSLDGLRARTEAALARFCWAWAWDELARDFPFDVDGAAPKACPPPEVDAALDRVALRAWVLQVVVRGRLEHLRRWIRDGRTGDRDSTWGRLRASLPVAGSAQVQRGVLYEDLDEALAAARPTLVALAALPEGRDRAAAARALLDAHAAPGVPAPRGGAPAMCRAAAEFLAKETV